MLPWKSRSFDNLAPSALGRGSNLETWTDFTSSSASSQPYPWPLKPAGENSCVCCDWKQWRESSWAEKSLSGGCSLCVMNCAFLLPARSVQKTGKICILRSPWSVGGLAAVPLSINIRVSHTAWQSTRLRSMLPAPGSPLPTAALSCSCPLQTSFEKFFKDECSNYIFCSLIYICFILFAVLLYLGHSLSTALPFFFPSHYPW